jgi:peroxiredoxin
LTGSAARISVRHNGSGLGRKGQDVELEPPLERLVTMSSVVLIVLAAIEILLLVLLAGVVYQLFQQQGRMFVQLEIIEQMIPEIVDAAGHHEGRRRGVPVAMSIPPFKLPDLEGTMITLDDFEGRRALLVNWSTTCGFCDAIIDDLAKVQDRLAKRDVDVVLVSRGDPEENRRFVEERGLECRILLQPEGNGGIAAFAGIGTPAAYLIDEHGRVAKPMALGADEVPSLVHEAAGRQLKLSTERPLTESRIRRDGLPAGTPAPSFSLPSVSGGKISLEQFRGSETLVVFSDPDCGPCEVLADNLARWHGAQDNDRGPALVMISRGGVDANRQKVEEHGITFPVAIQPRWKVSKEYGIFATPVGFLLDEHGVISRDVARGPEEIMALARDARDHGKEVRTR